MREAHFWVLRARPLLIADNIGPIYNLPAPIMVLDQGCTTFNPITVIHIELTRFVLFPW